MIDSYMNDVDMLDDLDYNSPDDDQEDYDEDFGIATKDPHVRIVNNNYVIGEGKKYIRTTMVDPLTGNTVSARITCATGEIKPYKYSKSKVVEYKPTPNKEFKWPDNYAAQGDLLSYTPSWTHIAPPERSLAKAKGVDALPKMRKSKANPNKLTLEEFLTVREAIEAMPFLDDLLVGVANLDCGNTRPLKTGLLFGMLRDLDEINVETIFAYTGSSEKHCWRLAQYMRVLSVAFDKQLEAKETI